MKLKERTAEWNLDQVRLLDEGTFPTESLDGLISIEYYKDCRCEKVYSREDNTTTQMARIYDRENEIVESEEEEEEEGEENKVTTSPPKSSWKTVSTPSTSKTSGTSSCSSLSASTIRLLSVGIFFLLAFVNVASSGSGTTSSFSSLSTPFTFPQFAEKIAIFARYVNGISIGQSISNGTLDKNKLIDEVFPLGPNMNLDSLATSTVFGLIDELKSIQTVIDTECSGNNGCRISNSDFSIMKTVESFQTYLSVIKKAQEVTNGKEMEKFTQLNSLVFGIENTVEEKVTAKLIDSLTAFTKSSSEAHYDLHLEITGSLKKLTELRDALTNGAALIDEVETVLPRLETKLNSIFPLAGISSKLHSHSSVVLQLRNNFKEYEKKYAKLAPSVKIDKIQNIKSMIAILMNLKLSLTAKREITAGFCNGFDDFKSASTIDSDKWLKGLLNSGMDLNETSSQLSHLKPLTQDFGALSTSFKSAKQLLNSQFSDIATLVENLAFDSRFFDSIQSYSSCLQNIMIWRVLNLNDEADIKNGLKSTNNGWSLLKPTIESFISTHKTSLDSVSTLANLIKTSITQQTQFDANHLKNVDQMIQDLRNFDSDLQKINYQQTQIWLEDSSVQNTQSKTQDWLKDSGLISMMECIGSRDFYGEIQKLNTDITSLLTLKTGNKGVEAASKFVESLKSLVVEWNKVKPTLSSKSKRAAHPEVQIQKVSKGFGDINSNTQKLNDISKMETDVNNQIIGRQIIDNAIGGANDKNKINRLKTMWSDGNLEGFNKILEFLNPSAKNIATLKPANKEVQLTTNSFDELSSRWTKLKPTLASKPKRAAKSNLKNAQKVSKDLGDISSIDLKSLKPVKKSDFFNQTIESKSETKIVMKNAEKISEDLGDIVQIVRHLQDLSDMYKYFNPMITRKYVIGIAIDKLENEEDKKYLKSFWNDENIEKLRWNMKTLNNVAREIVKYEGGVQYVSDLRTIFEKVSEVEEMTFDFKNLARILRGKIDDEEIGPELEYLRDFQVEFRHYSILRIPDLINGLQEFVDSNFGVRRRPPPPPPETKPKYYYPDKKAQMEYINHLVMCWAVIMTIIFGCILLFLFYGRSLIKWNFYF